MNHTQTLFLDYEFDKFSANLDMSNKLFCTFIDHSEIEDTVSKILQSYDVLYHKIFILKYTENSIDKYVCTYNVDMFNVLDFLDSTILVHRKKHTNSLYTINALNELIKELNEGRLDKNYNVDWNDYRNTLLITKGEELFKFRTFLHNIVEV